MRILCPKCNSAQEVVQVSPDYSDEQAKEFQSNAILIRFIVDGQAVDEFMLSLQFAQAHGIKAGDVLLPLDYPAWTKELKAVCRHCFEN